MRFILRYDSYGVPKYWDKKDNKEYYSPTSIVELLNRLSRAEEIIDDKLIELENDYNRGARLGLPTGSLIGEMMLLEEIKEELERG